MPILILISIHLLPQGNQEIHSTAKRNPMKSSTTG